MDALAGMALKEFRKENDRNIGDSGLFTPPEHARHPSSGPVDDQAYLKFLKEEQELRLRLMRKRDRQRVALVVVFSLLPLILFLLGFWMRH